MNSTVLRTPARSRARALITALLLTGCGGQSDPDAAMVPDAPSPDSGQQDSGGESCGTESATRTAACGNCGLESQTCTAGLWVGDGTCLSQGECSVGAVESRTALMCQEERRICDDSCTWRDWSPVGDPGACLPGEIRSVEGGTCGPGTWTETCADTCEWTSTCEDPCRGMRRTSPWYAEEICIPGGEFRRGGGGWGGPYMTVFVSTFLIDRYPVTNGRVQACVGMPDCPFLDGAADPTRPDFPIAGVSKQIAERFCAWTGGRLPTEAEYEKAFRGPAPREGVFPWGDAPDCDRLPIPNHCAGAPPYSMESIAPTLAVTALPGIRSYYGVDMLTGGGRTWVEDVWDPGFYSRPESLRDPRNPPTPGVDHISILRGSHVAQERWDEGSLDGPIPRRLQASSGFRETSPDQIIRCARSVPTEM